MKTPERRNALNAIFRIAAAALVLLACAACATGGAHADKSIPPQGKFGRWHPAYEDFQKLLAAHASRRDVEREIADEAPGTVRSVTGRAQFLAIPPSMPPSKRALALIDRWPRAIYAQLIDDVRVLACFDAQDRLVAFELF